jgi:hypothetical protein
MSVKLYVTVEGGLVQGFASSDPQRLADVEIIVIDYDLTDPDEGAVEIDQGNGRAETATLVPHELDPDPLNLADDGSTLPADSHPGWQRLEADIEAEPYDGLS